MAGGDDGVRPFLRAPSRSPAVGEMDGVMRGRLPGAAHRGPVRRRRHPGLERRFGGTGRGTWSSRAPISTWAGGVFRRGPSTALSVDGSFALGRRPEGSGGGEDEMDARFGLTELPAQHVRDRPSGWWATRLTARSPGTIHLRGASPAAPTATARSRWGAASPTASRSTGPRPGCASTAPASGSRGSRFARGDGRVTGAMYIRWNGTYSVNADGQGLALATAQIAARTGAPVHWRAGLHGLRRRRVRGSALHAERDHRRPGRSRGARGRPGERPSRPLTETPMQVALEAASPSLAVSGSGRITLAGDGDAAPAPAGDRAPA